MFKKLKLWFKPQKEYKPNISEPIYTIVEKVKQDIKRITVTIKENSFFGIVYSIKDNKTGVGFHYHENTQLVECPSFTLTDDEMFYMIREIKHLILARRERYLMIQKIRRERKERVSREQAQRLFEDS